MTDRYTFIVSGTYNWVPPLCVVLFSLLLFPGFSLIFTRGRKITKGTVSFVMSVCMSGHPYGTDRTNFHKIWRLCIFQKSVASFQGPLNSDKNNGNFTWRPMYSYDKISLNYFWTRYVTERRHREYQNIHVMFRNVFLKIMPFWDIVKI